MYLAVLVELYLAGRDARECFKFTLVEGTRGKLCRNACTETIPKNRRRGSKDLAIVWNTCLGEALVLVTIPTTNSRFSSY
mmetsp:Transcript_20784/g.27349  ORF Transcript_20784/g.27349 Transcript_20784/m.27349 type:complete len:80 (+) Transcript_20784:618-857(+)